MTIAVSGKLAGRVAFVKYAVGASVIEIFSQNLLVLLVI